MYIDILIMVLVLGIIFVLLGLLFTYFIDLSKNSLSLNFVYGFIVALAIFQFVAVPLTFLGTNFIELYLYYLAIITFLLIVSLVINRERLLCGFLGYWAKAKSIQWTSFNSISIKNINWYIVALFMMFIFQVFIYQNFHYNIQGDDTFFVGVALTAVETNTLHSYDPRTGMLLTGVHWRYVLSPYPILQAIFSNLFNAHPAIFIRNIWPIVLNLFCMAVYYHVGKALFKENKETAIKFVFWTVLIIIFSGVRVGAPSYFFLLYFHIGKSLLYVGLLPLAFYFYMRLFWYEPKKMDWIMLFCFVLASALTSSMAMILISLCIGMFALLYLVTERKIKKAFYLAICCIPNVIYAMLFFLNVGLRIIR